MKTLRAFALDRPSWRHLTVAGICTGAGLWLGGWPWQDDIDALQRLRGEVQALQDQPSPAKAAEPPLITTLPAESRSVWPDVRQTDAIWSRLQLQLQAHRLQLLALQPGPLEWLAGWPTQVVALEVQGRWEDWRRFERWLDQGMPWWTVTRWQATPLAAA